jgi:multicomponent Na+:H+ antiporter subunit F
MSAADILDIAANITLAAISLALLLTAWRILVGPTLPDRVVALDLLIGVVIGLIATISLKTGYQTYLDIAIALGLVGFLATVAFARFILNRGQSGDAPTTLPSRDDDARARHRATREAAERAGLPEDAANPAPDQPGSPSVQPAPAGHTRNAP